MKKHNGIRPQDIVILLKIATKLEDVLLLKDLAIELSISASEVSESIHRSIVAGFISADKKTLIKSAMLEFLQHGLKYAFPQKPGALVRGIATAHSAPPLNNLIQSEEPYVWLYAEGTIRGQSIEPLYPSVPKACLRDQRLYELLALTDALRVGKSREQQIAMEEIKKRLC